MPARHHDPSLLSALRLIRSAGVGPVTYRRLVDRFGSAEAVLAAAPNFKKPIHPPETTRINVEISALEKLGGTWVHYDHPAYPGLMYPLDDAPPVLATRGDVSLLQRPMIGIVGSRNASANGRRLTQILARELGQMGYVIVSGLARGIDTAAHEAALETGTIAVLANGVDMVYPPENQKLYNDMAAKGLLVSENPMGTEPAAPLFPRRNRIISGLCEAVIVVEANLKSGSLITARYALDQGREVFAIPGSPLDPRASGPNHLIKTGQAHLVETAEDIMHVLNGLRRLDIGTPHMRHALDSVADFDGTADKDTDAIILSKTAQDDLFSTPQKTTGQSPSFMDTSPVSMTDDQARLAVLGHLGPTPCDINHLAHAIKMDAAQILPILVELELLGQIKRLGGNTVALNHV